MLAKKVEIDDQDWDKHLPYVLFVYRASLQDSTQESPFYLLYGRDPQLSSSLGLEADPPRGHIDLCAYMQWGCYPSFSASVGAGSAVNQASPEETETLL
jgi:hypothetical protein